MTLVKVVPDRRVCCHICKEDQPIQYRDSHNNFYCSKCIVEDREELDIRTHTCDVGRLCGNWGECKIYQNCVHFIPRIA
jgi:hypothetical protein